MVEKVTSLQLQPQLIRMASPIVSISVARGNETHRACNETIVVLPEIYSYYL